MVSDEQLMRQAKEGDREALSALFSRYQGPLYNFFLRSCGRVDDAEDLAMETLLRVFRHAEHFSGTGSFRAWIYRLAVNVSHDRARRAKRRPEVLSSVVRERWLGIEDDRPERRPETMALRGDLAEAVRSAVYALPEKERTALLLREYQQLTYAEIALAMGVSLSAVKMLILRGRDRVRKRLEPHFDLQPVEVFG